MTLAFYINENILSVMLRACGPRPRRKIIKCFRLSIGVMSSFLGRVIRTLFFSLYVNIIFMKFFLNFTYIFIINKQKENYFFLKGKRNEK